MATDQPRDAQRHTDTESEVPQRLLSVLIIDPDVQAAQVLAALLQATCIVGLATTAADAFKLIQQRIPDIIVTELLLPDRTGLDLITSLRQTPETHHILLVVVTQQASIQDKVAAFTAGADDYLVKPVSELQLTLHFQLLRRFRLLMQVTP